MTIAPISWYFHRSGKRLLVGPSGFHTDDFYELESANPYADKFLECWNPGVLIPTRYYLGKHHAQLIRTKWQIPSDTSEDREIPNVAIKSV